MLSNSDIQKLLSVLASKEDLNEVKEDIKEVREELKHLASKEDLNEVKEDLKRAEYKLGRKIDKTEVELKELNKKVDTIVEFTFEVDEDTNRRLKRVEKHLNLPQIQT